MFHSQDQSLVEIGSENQEEFVDNYESKISKHYDNNAEKLTDSNKEDE